MNNVTGSSQLIVKKILMFFKLDGIFLLERLSNKKLYFIKI
jgi:hypothetical protein